MRPGLDRPLEETIQRSLGRRAMRALRPHLEGIPREELWVVGFDERCMLVGTERLAVREEGEPLAAPLSLLGWAEAKGARAIVLVQNQPGSRQAATPLALLPTLKVAAAATLFGLIVVDHIILHGGGSVTQLRGRTALAGAQAFALQLQTDLEDLAASHRGFGLPRAPDASALG
jgi:DNA repair protein RadC